MAGTSERRGLAGQVAVYLPAAAALVCILAAGIFAERQSSDLARLTEARSVRQRSEAAAADLYDAIMPQIQAVERLAGALAVRPAADAADLAGLLPVARAAETVAVLPPDGAPIVYPEGAGARAALATAAAAPLGAGGGFVDDPDGDWFVLWTDVPAGGRTAVATPAALVTAAARRESAGLAASLAGPQASVQRIAGSDAAPVDPLEVPVALPGGGWTLRAAPVGGWEPAGARWPIRLATLVAAALIVGPMIRNRHLVEDRQQTITALGEREAELAQLSRRLELALDASRVGVWDYSFDTDRLVWDDRMDELYGYVPGDRPRSYLDWRDRLHPDDLARAEAEFREAIEVTGRYVSDYRLVLPGNHVRHIRAIGAVYRGAAGGSQIVGVNWDVTADVLRNEELNARRLEAENASLAKSQFLATMCHEIRTPMNGVSGMLDLMLRPDLDPDQRGRAVVARTSADQLLAILNDILDLSKLEANRVTVESVAANVHRMARDVVALMAAGSGGRDVAVTVEIAPDVPRVLLCDAKRVRQVLMNLVGNAVKFTEAGGVQVRLGYAPEVDRLEVAVRDTGIGITDEAKRTLFQRFTQVDSAVTRKRGGT